MYGLLVTYYRIALILSYKFLVTLFWETDCVALKLHAHVSLLLL